MNRFIRDIGGFIPGKKKTANAAAPAAVEKKPTLRSANLALLDSYYEGTQYDHLMDWDAADQLSNTGSAYIPVRKRKPRVTFNFAKTFSQRVASKLVGERVFPTFKIADQPEDEAFIKAILDITQLRAKLLEPVRRMLNGGSSYVRFYVKGGKLKIEHYSSNHCYPKYDEADELSEVEVRYVYDDPDDLKADGTPKKKWMRLLFTTTSEILFDNPEYVPGETPEFQVVEQIDHNLGFVQGQWFSTSENTNSPEGFALSEDILGFIDEINYSLSQSSRAISYNQDPQLLLSNMSIDEVEELIRSAAKSWNMGKEGKAEFLESDLNGVKVAAEFRKEMRTNIIDIARVVLMDPEKMVSHATSGKAMEVLHGPLLDMVDELRPLFGENLKSLVTKIAMTLLMSQRMGIEIPIVMPPLYTPTSLAMNLEWPPVFRMTTEDLQKLASLASSLASANLFSRETMTRYLAKYFDVVDVEAELAKIADQPVLNPFGVF